AEAPPSFVTLDPGHSVEAYKPVRAPSGALRRFRPAGPGRRSNGARPCHYGPWLAPSPLRRLTSVGQSMPSRRVGVSHFIRSTFPGPHRNLVHPPSYRSGADTVFDRQGRTESLIDDTTSRSRLTTLPTGCYPTIRPFCRELMRLSPPHPATPASA